MQDQNKLVVYHDACSLALTLEGLLARVPRGYGEKRRQLLEAAWSISTNIAEGCGASTSPEFARFLDMAMKSLKETEHHVSVAAKLGVLGVEQHRRLEARIETLRRQLFTLIARVRGA